MDKAKRLAVELFKMSIPSYLDPSKDIIASWKRFESDLAVSGEVLDVFKQDEEAARTVRDCLCGWARLWGRWHPNRDIRPWYRAVAVAADAGNWDGVSRLCRALIKEEERHET